MKRVATRKIRDTLRLNCLGVSTQEIEGRIGVGRTIIAGCLRRASAAELFWLLPDGQTNGDLEAKLCPAATVD